MSVLTTDVIELDVKVESAEMAIQKAGDLLVQTGQVTPKYVKAMIQSFQDMGPYIVIAPGIALPHARPEQGVQSQCMSLVRLQKAIEFGHETNDPVRLVCAIGGVDQTSHLKMLQQMSQTLGSKDKMKILMETSQKEEIVSLFQS